MPTFDEPYLTEEQRRQRREVGDFLLGSVQDQRQPRVDSGPTPQEEWDAQWQETPMKRFMDEKAAGDTSMGPSGWLENERTQGRIEMPAHTINEGMRGGTRDYSTQTAIRDRMRDEAHERMQANRPGLEEREYRRAADYYGGNYASPFGAGNINNPAPFNPLVASPQQQAGAMVLGPWQRGPQGMRPIDPRSQIELAKMQNARQMNDADNQTKLDALRMKPAQTPVLDRDHARQLAKEIEDDNKEIEKLTFGDGKKDPGLQFLKSNQLMREEYAKKQFAPNWMIGKFSEKQNLYDYDSWKDHDPGEKYAYKPGSYQADADEIKERTERIAEIRKRIETNRRELEDMRRQGGGAQPQGAMQ